LKFSQNIFGGDLLTIAATSAERSTGGIGSYFASLGLIGLCKHSHKLNID
jgi:hypothetical protein